MGYDIEKEKREAIEAGQRALSSLRTAKENLNSAKNWGLVDMFGGGFFSTMLKHSKMDQARQNMEQAKYDLRNFSTFLSPYALNLMVVSIAKKSMLSGSMAVLFEVFFPVPEALEHPHARQAVISIIDKIFFITKSPQTIMVKNFQQC